MKDIPNLNEINEHIAKSLYGKSLLKTIKELSRQLDQTERFMVSGMESIKSSDYLPLSSKLYNANKFGVYFLFHFLDDELAYIGRATEVNSRVGFHRRAFINGGVAKDKTKDATAIKKMYAYDDKIENWGIFFWETPNLPATLQFEEDAILYYQPKFNSLQMAGK